MRGEALERRCKARQKPVFGVRHGLKPKVCAVAIEATGAIVRARTGGAATHRFQEGATARHGYELSHHDRAADLHFRDHVFSSHPSATAAHEAAQADGGE